MLYKKICVCLHLTNKAIVKRNVISSEVAETSESEYSPLSFPHSQLFIVSSAFLVSLSDPLPLWNSDIICMSYCLLPGSNTFPSGPLHSTPLHPSLVNADFGREHDVNMAFSPDLTYAGVPEINQIV